MSMVVKFDELKGGANHMQAKTPVPGLLPADSFQANRQRKNGNNPKSTKMTGFLASGEAERERDKNK
jgi:hypothetical protein